MHARPRSLGDAAHDPCGAVAVETLPTAVMFAPRASLMRNPLSVSSLLECAISWGVDNPAP